MKKYIILALALVAMAGCAKDDNSGGSLGDGDNAVAFSSTSLDSKLNSSGEEWIAGDTVGIFMYNQSKAVYTFTNVPYTATSSATTTSFAVVEVADAITYPNGGDVSFRAYYPYLSDAVLASSASGVGDVTLSVDIADQTDHGAIDFMVSDEIAVAWGDNSTNTNVALTFDHKLSKLSLSVEAGESIADLSSLSVTLSGIATKVEYDLSGEQGSVVTDNQSITMQVAVDASKTKATATAVVHSGAMSGTLTFALSDRSYDIALGASFTAGKQHNYPVALGESGAEFTGACTVGEWKETTETENDFYSEPVFN